MYYSALFKLQHLTLTVPKIDHKNVHGFKKKVRIVSLIYLFAHVGITFVAKIISTQKYIIEKFDL